MNVIILADGRDAFVRRLAAALAEVGVNVELTDGAGEAEHMARTRAADAVVFDPGAARADFQRRFSGRRGAYALVAWTAGFSSSQAAALLEQGADEVLHGAMTGAELIARLRKAVEAGGRGGDAWLELGPLRLDAAEGEVTWRGREIALSRREREVLQALAESAGRTVPREALYRRVWGYAMARGDRTVDVNVKRLRDKLSAAGASVLIETRPGIGYKLDVVTDEPARRRRAPVPAAAGRPEA